MNLILLILIFSNPAEASIRDEIKLLCKRTSSYNRCIREFNKGYSKSNNTKTNRPSGDKVIGLKVIPYK